MPPPFPRDRSFPASAVRPDDPSDVRAAVVCVAAALALRPLAGGFPFAEVETALVALLVWTAAALRALRRIHSPVIPSFSDASNRADASAPSKDGAGGGVFHAGVVVFALLALGASVARAFTDGHAAAAVDQAFVALTDGLLFGVLIDLARDRRRFRIFLSVLVAGGVWASGYALYQRGYADDYFRRVMATRPDDLPPGVGTDETSRRQFAIRMASRRVTGPFGYANTLAGVATMTAAVLAALSLRGRLAPRRRASAPKAANDTDAPFSRAVRLGMFAAGSGVLTALAFSGSAAGLLAAKTAEVGLLAWALSSRTRGSGRARVHAWGRAIGWVVWTTLLSGGIAALAWAAGGESTGQIVWAVAWCGAWGWTLRVLDRTAPSPDGVPTPGERRFARVGVAGWGMALAGVAAFAVLYAGCTPDMMTRPPRGGGFEGRVDAVRVGLYRTIHVRQGYWRAGLAMAADYPVRGVGLDNYASRYPGYRAPGAWSVRRAHNHYIQLAADGGLPLLAAFLLLLAVAARRIFSGADGCGVHVPLVSTGHDAVETGPSTNAAWPERTEASAPEAIDASKAKAHVKAEPLSASAPGTTRHALPDRGGAARAEPSRIPARGGRAESPSEKRSHRKPSDAGKRSALVESSEGEAASRLLWLPAFALFFAYLGYPFLHGLGVEFVWQEANAIPGGGSLRARDGTWGPLIVHATVAFVLLPAAATAAGRLAWTRLRGIDPARLAVGLGVAAMSAAVHAFADFTLQTGAVSTFAVALAGLAWAATPSPAARTPQRASPPLPVAARRAATEETEATIPATTSEKGEPTGEAGAAATVASTAKTTTDASTDPRRGAGGRRRMARVAATAAVVAAFVLGPLSWGRGVLALRDMDLTLEPLRRASPGRDDPLRTERERAADAAIESVLARRPGDGQALRERARRAYMRAAYAVGAMRAQTPPSAAGRFPPPATPAAPSPPTGTTGRTTSPARGTASNDPLLRSGIHIASPARESTPFTAPPLPETAAATMADAAVATWDRAMRAWIAHDPHAPSPYAEWARGYEGLVAAWPAQGHAFRVRAEAAWDAATVRAPTNARYWTALARARAALAGDPSSRPGEYGREGVLHAAQRALDASAASTEDGGTLPDEDAHWLRALR